MHGRHGKRRRFRGRNHLAGLQNGTIFRISDINGNRESRNKLYEMGLYPGKTGSVLSINSDGGVVIISDDLKIMLTSALAENVIVN